MNQRVHLPNKKIEEADYCVNEYDGKSFSLYNFETNETIELLKYVDMGDFHIGDGIPDRKAICKCGNDKFTVGAGSYRTSLKCDKCGVEVCVHEG